MLASESPSIPRVYRDKGTRLWIIKLDYEINHAPEFVSWGRRQIPVEQFTQKFINKHHLLLPVVSADCDELKVK